MTLKDVLKEIDSIQNEKRVFAWNESTDEALLRCVEYFSRTGFNRLENGAVGTWKLRVGFWKAIASALSFSLQLDNGPSPGACDTRWPIVLEKYTNPDDPFPRVHFNPSIDLSQYDDAWSTASSVVIDYQQDVINRIKANLESINEQAGSLAADTYNLLEIVEDSLGGEK